MMEKETIKKLKNELEIACPLCNKEYSLSNIRQIGRAGTTVLSHSMCPNCRGATLSLMYENPMGLTFMGLATDLQYEEVLKFREAKAICEDDVLKIYQLLG